MTVPPSLLVLLGENSQCFQEIRIVVGHSGCQVVEGGRVRRWGQAKCGRGGQINGVSYAMEARHGLKYLLLCPLYSDDDGAIW